jgi:hypothetical protein
MTPQTADDKPRWVYRFDNYRRALNILRELRRQWEKRTIDQALQARH